MGKVKKLSNTYSKGEMFGYLVGMFGQNIIYQVIAAGLISYYMGSVLYIPAVAISVIIFIARIWDALNDPMMGTIVDKTHTKWGKCRPYLIIFPAIIGLMTILCFLNGRYTDAEGFGKILIVGWAALSYIVWGMLFTVCDIPLWGITSLMTEDEGDRSKIIGLARVAAGIGGFGTVISFIPDSFKGLFEAKYNAMVGTVDGYTQAMAIDDTKKAAWIFTVIVVTVAATICFEIAGLVTKERVPGNPEDKRGILENFKIMWNCKPFRQILISGVIRSPLQLLMILAVPLMMYCYLDNSTDNIGSDNLIIKVGLIALMDNQYKIRSNRESGDGRYDISLFPKNDDLPGIIIEVKWDKDLDDDELNELAAKALEQIDDKKYETELRDDGITDIIKFGMAFSGKHVLIKTR